MGRDVCSLDSQTQTFRGKLPDLPMHTNSSRNPLASPGHVIGVDWNITQCSSSEGWPPLYRSRWWGLGFLELGFDLRHVRPKRPAEAHEEKECSVLPNTMLGTENGRGFGKNTGRVFARSAAWIQPSSCPAVGVRVGVCAGHPRAKSSNIYLCRIKTKWLFQKHSLG